jgi:hypothetical protein
MGADLTGDTDVVDRVQLLYSCCLRSRCILYRIATACHTVRPTPARGRVRRVRSGELCWRQFLGREAEARACASEAQRLDPILTIEWLRANPYSKERVLVSQPAGYEGLLRAEEPGSR